MPSGTDITIQPSCYSFFSVLKRFILGMVYNVFAFRPKSLTKYTKLIHFLFKNNKLNVLITQSHGSARVL